MTPAENLGFGPAVNVVAERTAAPWLVAANADVWLEPDARERLRACAASDERVAVVGPRLLLLDGFDAGVCAAFPERRQPDAAADLRRARECAGAPRAAHCRQLGAGAAGGRALDHGRVRADAPARNRGGGRFDPAQWLHAEDMDLCWRH
jgi:GT2 family glycosyltransferase